MTEERISLLKKGAGKLLAFTFVLVFLFAQGTSLLHTHAGDLSKHVDCELCLKVGSGDDALFVTHSTPELAVAAAQVFELSVLAVSLQLITAKSRSPPRHL